MSDDGRLLTLGALGVLVAGAAARAMGGSRATQAKPWIHYDAIAKGDIANLTTMLNEMIARGVPRKKADQILEQAMSKSPELEQRGMQFVNAFLEAGQQVFVVGPHLEQMFVNTGLDRVPREVIRAPYKAFYIALPSSTLRLYSQRNGWCALRGMYVDADERRLRLLLYGPCATKAEPNATNEAYLYFDLDEVYARSGDLEGYLVDKLTEALRIRNVALPPDALAEVTATQIQALRIAVNLMLYCNAAGADLTADPSYLAELALYKKLMAEKRKIEASRERERTKRREIERIDQKIQKLSGATVVWIGRGIEERNAESVGGNTRRRHWVRGHWRIPARKSGEKLLVWVQPYERNIEEETKVTRHIYKGDESEN